MALQVSVTQFSLHLTLSQHIGLVARHVCFWYATSGRIINTIELHDLGKMSVTVEISFTAVMQTKTAFASGSGGRDMY